MHRGHLCLAIALGACGGGQQPADRPPVISAVPTTRVVVEDAHEEGPEDGVEFASTRGHMEIAVIEAGIAPHKQALSDCYTTNLKKRRWLGGTVIIHWDIAKDGTVTAVRLGETEPGTNLGNWQIEKCILDVARAATFGKPVGGDADFQIPLEFTAKGKLVSWDADQTLRAVGGQTAKLDACAKPKGRGVKERIDAPKGEVWITVYVGPNGKAQSVGFAGKATIADAWADCAEKAALAWRLPDPRGTVAKLSVAYAR